MHKFKLLRHPSLELQVHFRVYGIFCVILPRLSGHSAIIDMKRLGCVKEEELRWSSSELDAGKGCNTPQPMEGLHETGPPPFLSKTYDLVEDKSTNEIVSWSRDFALMCHIPKLLEEGFLDLNGSIKKGEKITLSDDIPAWSKDELSWSFSSDIRAEKLLFACGKTFSETTKQVEWVLSNTFYNLESSACDFIPNLLPIGPLLEANVAKLSSNIHQQDVSCLSWLDSKPPRSVVYVSFGSLAVFSQQQLEELAMGLELSGRSFLWVVRSDLANGKRVVYPDGFLERVGELGKIVEWAPQEKVLSHPSLACFLSHCGWNSILEGLSNGVPFLCWPIYGDQFHSQNYICDKWEIGLRIDCDENGIRLSHEIKKKIDVLFSYDSLKTNALKLKEMSEKSVREGGDSYKSFQKFMDHLRN